MNKINTNLTNLSFSHLNKNDQEVKAKTLSYLGRKVSSLPKLVNENLNKITPLKSEFNKSPKSLRSEKFSTSLVANALSTAEKTVSLTQRRAIFSQKPSRLNKASVNKAADLSLNSAMIAFKNDSGPKILLVPEGHGSKETIDARNFIKSNKEKIIGFSEGETGQFNLAGLRGIETQADFEVAPLLKEYSKNMERIEHGEKLQDWDLTSKEDVFSELTKFGVSENELKLIDKKFFSEPDPEKRKTAVTFFQNERRDLKLVESIIKECQNLKSDPDKKVSVGFFGATHLMDGFDDKNDMRTTDKRIPDYLQQIGKKQEHCISIKGVNVYLYPKALESNSKDTYFDQFF